jgi:3-oxosteroid 1-dehydrogenase
MAAAVGAALARMDQANIYPALPTLYEGQRQALPLTVLYHPHCILVDRFARRFLNEGSPNVSAALDTRDPPTGLPIHLPAWQIFDARYARRNRVIMRYARRDRHWLRQAGRLADLARLIALDPAALTVTVERFNGFARAGRDLDFNRGETAWERFYTATRAGRTATAPLASSSRRLSMPRPISARSSPPRAALAPMRAGKCCARTAAASRASIAPASPWPTRSAPRPSAPAP